MRKMAPEVSTVGMFLGLPFRGAENERDRRRLDTCEEQQPIVGLMVRTPTARRTIRFFREIAPGINIVDFW